MADIIERVVAYIAETDPFGDRFTAHDVERLTALRSEIEQLRRIRGLLIKALAAACDTTGDNEEMLEAPLTFAIKRRLALTGRETDPT